MPHAHLIEKALRSAVLTVFNDRQVPLQSLIQMIKSMSRQRLTELSVHLPITDFDVLQTNYDRIENDLINVVLKEFQLTHYESLDSEGRRGSFESERLSGVMSFAISNSKQRKSFSFEEIFAENFFELIKQQGLLAEFGLTSFDESPVALPLFKLRLIHHLNLEGRHIEKVCDHANVFFDTLLSGVLNNLDSEFYAEGAFQIFCESIFENKNYLNDRRLIGLVLNSIATALWFLMNPVSENAKELNISEKIALSNKILAVYHYALAELRHGHINKKCCQTMMSVLTHATRLVQQFRSAFYQEHKSAISFNEIDNVIQNSLYYINRDAIAFLFEGIRPVGNILTLQGPYGDHLLANIIHNLLSLTTKDKNALRNVTQKLTWLPQEEPVANKKAETLMDLLIYFSHATPSKKTKLLDEIILNPNSYEQAYYHPLLVLNENFIEPLYKYNEKVLNLPLWDNKRHKKIAQKTARELLPIYCMVIEVCQIQLEPNFSGLTVEKNSVSNVNTSYEQFCKIQRMNIASAPYYDKQFIRFEKNQAQSLYHLQGLLPRTDKMLASLAFNRILSEVITVHSKLLTHLPTIRFIQVFINQVIQDYDELATSIQIESNLFKQQLVEMAGLVKLALGPIAGSIKLLETQESAVWYETELSDVQNALDKLNENSVTLFGIGTGIAPLFTRRALAISEPDNRQPNSAAGSAHMLTSLCRVIDNCQNALSSHVAGGLKQKGLSDLSNVVRQMFNTENEDINQIKPQVAAFAEELARIAIKSRQRTCSLFQAAPGSSKTARCLYNEMINSRYDDEFPLAQILLGKDFDIHAATEADIRLAMLQKYENYQLNQLDNEDVARVVSA